MDYTRSRQERAQGNIEQTGSDSDNNSFTDTKAESTRSLPESEQFTFADVPEDERAEYVGYAIKWEGVDQLGWLADPKDLSGDCLLLFGWGDGVCWAYAEPHEIRLLPDEPRMVIPGVTPEEEPENEPNPESRMLDYLEDIENVPDGTVIDADGDVFVNFGGIWGFPGSDVTFSDEQIFHGSSHIIVVRWGFHGDWLPLKST